MKEFIKKYRTDKKYNTKVELIFYAALIFFVTIFCMIGSQNTPVDNDDELTETSYDYKININLNDNIYQYYGSKNDDEITINKVVNEETISYSYKDNNYYKHENNVYVLTTEEEIYDVIAFNYLSLDTIYEYLDLSTITENVNIVYLKDIIIGSNSEEYITIEENDDNYKIDYTSLMKLFDNSIEKLTVEIIIIE